MVRSMDLCRARRVRWGGAGGAGTDGRARGRAQPQAFGRSAALAGHRCGARSGQGRRIWPARLRWAGTAWPTWPWCRSQVVVAAAPLAEEQLELDVVRIAQCDDRCVARRRLDSRSDRRPTAPVVLPRGQLVRSHTEDTWSMPVRRSSNLSPDRSAWHVSVHVTLPPGEHLRILSRPSTSRTRRRPSRSW